MGEKGRVFGWVGVACAPPGVSQKCADLPAMSNVNGNPFDNACINTGDTTWVLISTVLVLTMFGGLAFFEGAFGRLVFSRFWRSVEFSLPVHRYSMEICCLHH